MGIGYFGPGCYQRQRQNGYPPTDKMSTYIKVARVIGYEDSEMVEFFTLLSKSDIEKFDQISTDEKAEMWVMQDCLDNQDYEIPLTDHFDVSKVYIEKNSSWHNGKWTYRYTPTCEDGCSCKTDVENLPENKINIPVETTYMMVNGQVERSYHDVLSRHLTETPYINTEDSQIVLVQVMISCMNEDGTPLYILETNKEDILQRRYGRVVKGNVTPSVDENLMEAM